MQPDPRLTYWLNTDAAKSLSDADAATATAVPIYTPRTSRVTMTTLTASDVWGFTKTATFQAALQAVAAGGGATGAEANTLLSVLNGSGFDATDPQAASLAPAFVAMAAGAVTTADANLALGTISYPAGQPWQTADVTAARAWMADQVSRQKVIAAAASLLNEWLPTLDASPNAAAVIAQLQSLLTAGGVA